jgi:hypothetical protein
MPSTESSSRKRRRSKQPKRMHIVFDEASLDDLQYIQGALRTTSTTATLRVAIRLHAELIKHAAAGRQILLKDPEGNELPIMIDIPVPPNGASR